MGKSASPTIVAGPHTPPVSAVVGDEVSEEEVLGEGLDVVGEDVVVEEVGLSVGLEVVVVEVSTSPTVFSKVALFP